MKQKKTKALGFSTGRGTRAKHSTAMEWDEWAKKRRKYSVKYVTGEDAQMKHSTGKEFDKKAKYRREEYEANKRGGAKHPGFTYKHYRKKDEEQSKSEKESPKPFKKVTIDY